MPGIEWNENHRIGIEILDKEHRKLFRVINKLFEISEEGKDVEWACQEGVKFFENHALKHFAEEEAYMESIRFENYEHHKRIHDVFRETTLPVLRDELERTKYSKEAVDHFLGVAAAWLLSHTLTEDMAIVGRGSTIWDSTIQGDDLEAMKQVILEYVFDMFDLESHVVSDMYGGERFGKGVYYRLVYRKPDGERAETFLIFEESFLIGTTGKILGLKTNKLDSRLMHAARCTAHQFVEQIHTHSEGLGEYQLIQENLMSYNDFRALFERNKPRVSILFDSGVGYFAYCFTTPRKSEADINVGIDIEEEHATEEIKEYLEARKQKKNKKKLLIVDDSRTMRELMRELLREDYEVSMADSGIAAIRALTLSKPDMVLLDYEMPVVDGSQTLQMFRQEKDLSDVPVVFLTGKGDSDSVKKLVSLKPQGYLLKTMKPELLKDKIDALADKFI